jgi:hypothetical protein
MIYQLDEESPELYTWYGALEPGENVEITLPNVNIPYGEHELTVWAYNPNLIPDIYPDNDEASISFNNEPGTNVEVTINFDALPYGFSWVLVNLDTGELVDEGTNYQNAEYSCTSTTFTYCLPEGNYELLLEDLFGNGMFYPCSPNWEPGSIYTISGNDTLASAADNWGDDELLLFYIGPPPVECPDYPCRLDLDNNGMVAVADVILVLGQFGQIVEPCTQMDFNDDGLVGVDDILEMLSNFGLICATGNMENVEIPEALKEMIQERTGIDMGLTGMDEFDFSHSSPIVINPYQIESMQDVLAVRYYDINGRLVNKEAIGQGIYIARIVMLDGSLETIKFYSQQ